MLPISRPTHSMDSKSTHSSKAPAPQAKGTVDASSSSGVVSGIKPKERPLAGYLMARTAMHKKVEGPDLQNLRSGHDSVQQACDLLPLGRGNVIQDAEKANGMYMRRRFAASLLSLRKGLQPDPSLPFEQVPQIDRNRILAAVGQYAGTGTCQAYAASAAPLHATKLAGMKDERAIVALSIHPPLDHVWSEVMPKGTREDGKPNLHGTDVILDGWCKEKTAVLREDSEYARLDKNGRGDHLTHHDFLDHASGPGALKDVEKLKARIKDSPALEAEFHDLFNLMVTENFKPPEKGIRNEESVFHADFREQAGKALHKDAKESSPVKGARNPDAHPVSEQVKHESLAKIQAVGVARSLGSNIRGAKTEEPGIIASAKDMFPRPQREIQAVDVSRSLGSNVRGAKAEASGSSASASEMLPRPEPKKKKGFSRISAFFKT